MYSARVAMPEPMGFWSRSGLFIAAGLIIVPVVPLSIAGRLPPGPLRLIRAVYSSTTSTPATRARAPFWVLPSSVISRSMLALTAAALNFVPSVNFTSSRSLSTSAESLSTNSHEVASCGTRSPVLSSSMISWS
jgi:hypothetical protein